jgi:ribosomal protein L40E
MKLKRGQKLCKKCNNINGARARVCKHCNEEFEIRGDFKAKVVRKRNKNLISIDWKNLSNGDEIYFRGRSGTYTINSDGTRDYSTDKGVYKVVDIKDNGFIAYGKKGHTFFYMGEEKQSKWLPNIYNAPHKIYVKKQVKIAQNV